MHILLFDIDGTLISSGGAGKAALEMALHAEFGIPRITDSLTLSGRTDRAILADLIRMHELDPSPTSARRLMASYLRHLPTSLGSNQGRVLPGIAALLELLRTRSDVALGLLTGNIRAGAEIKLGHFGLWDHFAFGGFGDDHEDRDDVARMAWKEVETRFDGTAHPDRVWVIGDTPLDVRCARAIGVKVLAVTTGWHSAEELAACEPDLLLEDLASPEPLLACLHE